MQEKHFYKKLSLITTLLLSTPLWATSLDELVQDALQNNSVIKKTELQIQLMEAKRAESKVKKLGEFDVVGSYNHYNLPRTLAPIVPSALTPGSSVDTTQDLFSTGVQYSMPLFTGGALEEQVAIDSLATQMGESKQKLSREELIYNVRSLYLSGLSLQELLTSQENYVQALNALKKTISYQVELGKRAKIDLLKANNDLTQAIGKVALTQSALRKIKATLTALTHSSVESLEPLDVQVNEENALLSEQNLESLERFRLQELEIAKSSKMIRKVESLKKPQVGLNAYAGYNYDLDQLSHFENEQIWQVGLNVKWNIFDFGATSAKVQQAKISQLQAIAQKESTNEGFQKLFAQAKNQIETAQTNYQTNASQYTLLEESQNIEQARYDAGVATLNDLLLAKSKTELAEVQMIQSKYAYQNGIFYLDYLLERGAK